MPEDDSKVLTKIGLLILKAIPSLVIEIELCEQERLALKEQRPNDLKFIRSIRGIKQEADKALDKWIINS